MLFEDNPLVFPNQVQNLLEKQKFANNSGLHWLKCLHLYKSNFKIK